MASFMERLSYIITANAKQAIAEFKQVRASAQADLGQADKAVSGFGATAKGAGAGLKGFAGGIAAAVGIGAVDQLRDAASGLEQSAGAIESVFGKSADVIREFGKTADQTAGLSKRAVNEMAAVIGASLQGMGFSAERAAVQTVELEKRAADLAATFGGTTQDAIMAIAAALRGERDPIERYGVSIKQADVNARIAALGLSTATTAAQKQSQAIATLGLLLDQSASSQNQFAREANTAAGAQSRASAEFENARAELGKNLLPAITFVTNTLGDLAKVLAVVAKVFGVVEKSVGAVGKVLDGIGKKIRGAIEWVGNLGGVLNIFGKESKDAGDKAEEAGSKVKAAGKKFDDQAESVEAATAALSAYSKMVDETADASLGIPTALDDIEQAFLDLEDNAEQSSKKAAEAQDRLADAIESSNRRIRDAQQDVADATEDLNKISSGDRTDARRRLRDAQERLTDAQKDGAEAIAEAKENVAELAPAVEDAKREAIELNRRMENVTTAVTKAAEEMIKKKRPVSEILALLTLHRDRLAEAGARIGANRAELEMYLGVLSAVYQKTKDLAALVTVNEFNALTPRERGERAGRIADVMTGGIVPGVIQNITINGVTDPIEAGRQIGKATNQALRRRG